MTLVRRRSASNCKLVGGEGVGVLVVRTFLSGHYVCDVSDVISAEYVWLGTTDPCSTICSTTALNSSEFYSQLWSETTRLIVSIIVIQIFHVVSN